MLQIVEWLTDLLSGLARYELTIYITFSTCKQILLTGHSVGGSKYPITSATLATRSGLTVRVQSSTWGNTFFFLSSFFSIPESLLMGSLSLQTVNKWQHFRLFCKVCAKRLCS